MRHTAHLVGKGLKQINRVGSVHILIKSPTPTIMDSWSAGPAHSLRGMV